MYTVFKFRLCHLPLNQRYLDRVSVELSTHLLGLSSQDFDSSAQTSFKEAMANCILGIDPYNINITSYYESNLTRRLERTYLRRNLESVAFLSNTSQSSIEPSYTIFTSITPPSFRFSSTLISMDKARRKLATTKLTVNWTLDFMLQDVMESNQDATILLSSFVETLSKVLSNTSNVEAALWNSDSQVFGSVAVENEPFNVQMNRLFINSHYPTGQPTSSPTDLYINAKLQHLQIVGPLVASQFYGMIGFVFGFCLLFPILFYFYRQRGEEKRKKMQLKISRMRFEANKAKLSDFHVERRNALRWAFRKKFGRDINVYADCMGTVEDVYQLNFDPFLNKSDCMHIPGSNKFLNLHPESSVGKKLIARLSDFSTSYVIQDPGNQILKETEDACHTPRRGVKPNETVDVHDTKNVPSVHLSTRDQITIDDSAHFSLNNVYLLYGDYPALINSKEGSMVVADKYIETKAFESLGSNHASRRNNDTSISPPLSNVEPKTLSDSRGRNKSLPHKCLQHDLAVYSNL